jgi:two-component system LytT family response regulator
MLNCLIIDDEQPAINIIEAYVRKTPFLQLIDTATDPILGMQLVRNQPIDLIFLDVEMHGLTGLEFIKAINGKCKIIIISAYSEFALEGFELEVIDYLLKPVPFPRFLKAAQKAYDIIKPLLTSPAVTPSDFIMVKGDTKGKLIKVEIDEIDYIESMGNYVAIFCKGKKFLSIMNLKTLEEKLPVDKFMRVHKSFIVAISQIALIEGNLITLKGDYKTEIAIGISYRTHFLEAMRLKLVN